MIADVHVYFDDAIIKGRLGVGPKTLLDLPGMQLGPISWVPLIHDHVVGLNIVDVVELIDGRIVRILEIRQRRRNRRTHALEDASGPDAWHH